MAAERRNASQKSQTLNAVIRDVLNASAEQVDGAAQITGDRDSSHLAERAAVAILGDAFEARCADVRREQFWHRAWRTALVVSGIGVVCAIGTYGWAGTWALIWPAAFDALRRQARRDIIDAFRERAIAATRLHYAEVNLSRVMKASGVFRKGEP